LWAYNACSKDQIVGGPDWIYTNRYDINTKIGASLYASMLKMPKEQRDEISRLMQQSLLADRLGLKVHFETRELPVYALVVANGGPKLTPAEDVRAYGGAAAPQLVSNKPPHDISILPFGKGMEWTAKGVTLDELVHDSAFAELPEIGGGGHVVVNKTRLTGAYDFKLRFALDRMPIACNMGNGDCYTAGPDDDTPSLQTALQEQLGLQLILTKAPVEVVVIDHIELP
jgi:bla regulator protein blaR1